MSAPHTHLPTAVSCISHSTASRHTWTNLRTISVTSDARFACRSIAIQLLGVKYPKLKQWSSPKEKMTVPHWTWPFFTLLISNESFSPLFDLPDHFPQIYSSSLFFYSIAKKIQDNSYYAADNTIAFFFCFVHTSKFHEELCQII